jgi:hypothetical protein
VTCSERTTYAPFYNGPDEVKTHCDGHAAEVTGLSVVGKPPQSSDPEISIVWCSLRSDHRPLNFVTSVAIFGSRIRILP